MAKTLIELRDAIAGKKMSATEAVRAGLARIEKLNPKLNAFSEVFSERALQRAAMVDTGKIHGRLAGVPVAIKDNLCTAYGRTTCSSRMLDDFHSPYTATAAAKLEAAGAIVLGKTNMDEFAMGSSTENGAKGPVRNPWNHDRVPGGSSGGSTAALAAEICTGALGSDTGGSIRQPAALCGVTGLKPTYGRVSRFGLVAFASSLDQVGPITRSVADAAELLTVISGRDEADSTSVDRPVPDYSAALDAPVKAMRLGLARQYLSNANDPAVRKMMDEAVATFRRLGVHVEEVDLPHTEYGVPTYYIVATAEASSNLARYDGVRYGHRAAKPDDLLDFYCRSRSEGFGAEVKRRIMLGAYVLSSGYYDAYYLKALKVRRLIRNDFDAAFKKVDAILCPTTTGPAFRIGEKIDDPLSMYLNDVYTVNCNLAGIPGLALPGGFAEAGGGRLPVGMQLLGAAFEEEKLLRLGHAFQRETAWHLESAAQPS